MPLWWTSHFGVINPQLWTASVASLQDLKVGTLATAASSPNEMVTMQTVKGKIC